MNSAKARNIAQRSSELGTEFALAATDKPRGERDYAHAEMMELLGLQHKITDRLSALARRIEASEPEEKK